MSAAVLTPQGPHVSAVASDSPPTATTPPSSDEEATTTAAPPAAAAGYRNYVNSAYQDRVVRLYAEKYANQTVEYATRMRQAYTQFNRRQMTVWDAAQLLESIVDESDPDTNLSQMQHALQTAEACRAAYPDQDWFHLLGFIHDLGKMLAHPTMGGLKQWEMVGDTFPVGCRMTEANVLHDLTQGNPDMQNPKYNTDLGIYTQGCGFDNVTWAWGHDEYLYHVLRNHKECKLPEAAFYCIRLHSFYPWHNKGGYKYLMNAQDEAMLPEVQRFQKCDLYSKVDQTLDIATLGPYYKGLIEKYVPGVVQW